jgi:rhodanese-related sulfurtransferase
MKTEIPRLIEAKESEEPVRLQTSSTAAPWQLLRAGFQEGATLAGCALFLALAVYGHTSLKPAPPVSTQEIASVQEDVLWIDARSEADFSAEHIPGAFSLNEKNWEDVLPSFFEVWKPSTPIIVYCDAGCPASAKIAARLEELGVDPVKIMEGGFQAWKRSKN